MSELPVWAVFSIAFGVGGAFVLGCVVMLFVLELLPSVQRFLGELLGGEEEVEGA